MWYDYNKRHPVVVKILMKGIRPYVMRAITALALIAVSAFVVPALGQRNEKLYNRPYADMKRWHLGFSVGGFMQDYAFTHNGYVTDAGEEWYVSQPDLSPGFCVNVMADLRLHRYFNLRFSPGMYFGGSTVRMRDWVSGNTLRQDIKTSYVVLPFELKVSGDRLGNSRPYFTVGAMGAFDVGKRRSDYIQLNKVGTYLTVGLGVDLYLPFFKLNPEIKFCFGLNDMLRHDRPDLIDDPETKKITDSLKKVKSNMCVITFYFE